MLILSFPSKMYQGLSRSSLFGGPILLGGKARSNSMMMGGSPWLNLGRYPIHDTLPDINIAPDGWNPTFLLGPGLFSGDMLVSGSVVIFVRVSWESRATVNIPRATSTSSGGCPSWHASNGPVAPKRSWGHLWGCCIQMLGKSVGSNHDKEKKNDNDIINHYYAWDILRC